jgi:hypothetical protein
MRCHQEVYVEVDYQHLKTHEVYRYRYANEVLLQLTDKCYQDVRKKCHTRKGFFRDICSLTKYKLFDGWQNLIEFMLYGKSPPQLINSS